jgi:molybdopterin adenylyltransferase
MADYAIRVAVLTVSDRASKGVYEDKSGPALVELVQKALGADVVATAIVPDERVTIADQLRAWADDDVADLVLTTGGTGFAPRDVTPEATADVLERDAPGLSEAMRTASRAITPYGMLSRGRAGMRSRCLIVNLPGSPKGATENLRVILEVLPHAIALLHEDTSHNAGHDFARRPMTA